MEGAPLVGPPHGGPAGSTSTDGTLTFATWLAMSVFGTDVRVTGTYVRPPGSVSLGIDLGSIPVGRALAQLVTWAEHGRTVKFDPPWDRLFDLTLPPITFTITMTPGQNSDPSTTSFAVTADDFSFDFSPFLSLTKLSLAYVPATGKVASKVNVVINGTFLGQKFDDQHPLTWDALSSPPPAVPTAAEKILVLRYLGLGQRVAVEAPKGGGGGPNPTLWDVIQNLEKAFAPVPAGSPPLSEAITFAPNGGWLAGIDFTLLNTVTVAALFDDPAMYGLHIALSGPKAGGAAGLEFDILYRKIGDNLGVYHAELTLPDALRHLDFGTVAITLPVIAVDVYTNGNFLIDLGFPYQLDFSRSFGVQMLPFVGAGGFYFGLLSQQTAPALPSPISGTFSPVIAFGLGLQVGVGKTVSYGVLSGGITVTVQGLIEGLIAGWRPGSGSDVAAVYYRITGQISITGHLYGAIDFVIIKASVDVYAYAGVALVMESHKPTQITLSAGVKVSVSVKIVFFTIHLSFSASVEASFVIGSASAAPWDAPAAKARIEAAAVAQALPPARSWEHVDLVAAGARSSKATVKVAFVPQVALGEVAAPGTGNEAKIVAVCFTDAAMPGASTSVPEGDTSFGELAGALLDWGLHLAGGDAGTVTAHAIRKLFDELATPEGDGGMTSETVLTFVAANLEFQLGDQTGFDPENATVFPMLPWLQLASASAPAYAADFALKTPAPAAYRDALGRYFAQLDPSTDGPSGDGRVELAEAEETLPGSLAAVVLADYCKLILRQLLGDALTRFRKFTSEPPHDGPAQGWLTWLTERYGLGPDALDQLAVANQSEAAFRSTYTVSGAQLQVRHGESPGAFCDRAAIGLDDLAAVVADSQSFLDPAASVAVDHGSYTIVLADVSRQVGQETLLVATDLLALLSTRFGCSPTALQAANPGVTDQQWTSLGPGETRTPPPLGAGSVVTLPPLTVVAGARSLSTLAAGYGTSAAQLLSDNSDGTTLIAPLFTIDLPDFTLDADDATPLEIAQRFGLTVAGLLAANDGAASDFGPVVVPGATSMPTDELADGVLGGGATAAAAAAVARFLLHGLRLPAPNGSDLGDSDALYSLTGQQFTAPTQPQGAQLVFSPTGAAGLATPTIAYPNSGSQLTVTLDADAVAAVNAYRALPKPPFPAGILGATRYPPYAVVPRRYALGRPVPWQRPTAWPGAVGGAAPKIYTLPASLLADVAAGSAAMVAAALSTAGVSGTAAPAPTPVPDARWAVRADFRIRRVHGPAGADDYVPGMYELVSSVGDASAELLALNQWIAADPAGRTPTIELLYSAGGQAGNAAGMRSDVVAPETVTLVKANLSTVTSKPSGLALAVSDDQVLVDATLDDAAFLELLWECSTVNAGGYYLRYGAATLPDILFESAPLVTLTVLTTVDEDPAPLRSFHNCMVTSVDEATSKLSLDIEPYTVALETQYTTLGTAATSLGLDPADFGAANATNDRLLQPGTQIVNASFPGGSYTIQVGDDLLAVAQLMGSTVEAAAAQLAGVAGLVAARAAVWAQPQFVQRSSRLPAAVSGFRLTRTQPATTDQLETAFHLLSYSVAGGDGFAASNDAMPLAPTTPTLSGVTVASPWRYQQVLPVAALAGGGSPYAGVGHTATLDLALQDLYGNRALPAGEPPPLPIPVYYHDPLRPIGAWPGARLSFAAAKDQPGDLTVKLGLDVASTVAAAADSPAAVAARAAEDFPRYTVAAAQLSCPGVQVALTTSLAPAVEQAVAPAALVAFAGRAHDYLEALAASGVGRFDAGGKGIATAAGELGVDPATLARANLDRDDVFAVTEQLTLPVMGAVVLGDSIAMIAGRAGSTAEELGTWNAAAPLAPDSSIQLGSRPYTTKSGDTLASLQPGDPGGLAASNAGVAGLFAEGTPLVFATHVAAAGPASLRTIAAAAGCTVDTLVALNGTAPLAAGTELLVPGRIDTSKVTSPPAAVHVVGAQDTFATVAKTTGPDAADLVRANAWTDGLLDPGKPARTISYDGKEVQLEAGDTPAAVAARFKALGVDVEPAELFLQPPNDVPGLLTTGAVMLVPPAPMATVMTVVPVLSHEPLVPLSVQATISRTTGVDPDLAGHESVAEATSPVAPDLPGTDPEGVRRFARDFEAAFEKWQLALATSTDDASAGFAGSNLYVVQIEDDWDGVSPSTGIAYHFESGAVSFDVPPVAQQPWSGDGVLVSAYVSGTGLAAAVPTSIRAVDLDAVHQRALADLDRFLEPASALAAHDVAPQAVRDVINAKYALADSVSKTVLPILEPEEGQWTGDVDAAIATMRQLMLVQSSQCYTTDALVQLRAHVVTPDAEELRARLNGTPLVTPNVSQRRWTARAGDHVGGLLSALGPSGPGDAVRAAFAGANADAPLEPGQDVVVGEAVQVVEPGQTLGDVAAALDVAPAQLVGEAPDTLADAGHTWTLTTDQQPITLTPAKLALIDGYPALTFGIRVASLQLHRNVQVELAYRPAELEYHVEEIADGYEQSSWLTFVNPRPESPLGEVTVPLPLRAFPATPRIVKQAWTQEIHPERPQWSGLGAGQFDFSFDYVKADQDNVTVRVDIDHGGGGLRSFDETGDGLPVALVRYQAAAEALWADLGQMPAAATITDVDTRKRLAIAAEAFAALIGAIASAWQGGGAGGAPDVPSGQAFTAIARPDGRRRVALAPAAHSDAPEDRRRDAALSNGMQRVLLSPEPGAAPRLGPWPFDVPADQQLWGVVDVVRNANLVDGRTTTGAFRYSLVNTRSSAPTIPCLRYTGDLDLRQAPALFDGGRLIDHLRNMFAAALDVTPGEGAPTCFVRVTSAWEFGFGAPPIDSGGLCVPAPAYTGYAHAFDPKVDFGETTGYSADLASVLSGWQPPTAPTAAAQWCLFVAVNSMSAPDSPPGPPLLEVQRVVLPLAAVK